MRVLKKILILLSFSIYLLAPVQVLAVEPPKPKDLATSTVKPPATSTTKPQEGSGYVARTYDGVDWEGSLSIKNPSNSGDVSDLVAKLINWLLMIIAMVSTIVIIYAGVMLIFNQGNESRIKSAKATLTWAVIGLVVAVSAFALVNIIQSLL
ncbi:hypothetical protein IPM19_04495 [bacterium]|nr:MAG: hypothetical protein IPM19_04495 [bacterium]